VLSELKNEHRVTGVKQSRKAVEEGRARKAFIARDADPNVTEPFEALCRENGVEVSFEDSMSEMGKACGISVGAAVAALLWEDR